MKLDNRFCENIKAIVYGICFNKGMKGTKVKEIWVEDEKVYLLFNFDNINSTFVLNVPQINLGGDKYLHCALEEAVDGFIHKNAVKMLHSKNVVNPAEFYKEEVKNELIKELEECGLYDVELNCCITDDELDLIHIEFTKGFYTGVCDVKNSVLLNMLNDNASILYEVKAQVQYFLGKVDNREDYILDNCDTVVELITKTGKSLERLPLDVSCTQLRFDDYVTFYVGFLTKEFMVKIEKDLICKGMWARISKVIEKAYRDYFGLNDYQELDLILEIMSNKDEEVQKDFIVLATTRFRSLCCAEHLKPSECAEIISRMTVALMLEAHRLGISSKEIMKYTQKMIEKEEK